MIAAMLVWVMVLILACTVTVVLSLDRHTERILARLKTLNAIESPETRLGLHTGAFTPALAAQAKNNLRGDPHGPL